MIELNTISKQGVQKGKMFGHQTRFDQVFPRHVKGAGLCVFFFTVEFNWVGNPEIIRLINKVRGRVGLTTEMNATKSY